MKCETKNYGEHCIGGTSKLIYTPHPSTHTSLSEKIEYTQTSVRFVHITTNVALIFFVDYTTYAYQLRCCDIAWKRREARSVT
jgi:hypothetical protein